MEEKYVWDSKALQDEVQQNIRDTIAHIYLKILKVNLTDDMQQNVMVKVEEMETAKGYTEKLSEWIKNFAEAGYVYKEDLQKYRSFCNLDYLRKRFRDGNKFICFHYRRKVRGEFRWVSVELVAAREYRDDNQVAYLYVRDIHDNYLRQLDLTVRRRMQNALSLVSLNLTGNKYDFGCGEYANLIMDTQECSVDDYLDSLSKYIYNKKKKNGEFRKKISRENLLRLFEKGEMFLTFVEAFMLEEDERGILKFTVIMEKDVFSGDVEAVIYTQDVTGEYLQNLFIPMLHHSKFRAVGVVDLRCRTIVLAKKGNQEDSKLMYSEVPYDEARQKICMEHVAPMDREAYMAKTTLENLKKNLEEDDGYGFLVYHEKDGEKTIKSYQCHYLSEEFELVIFTIEDVTSLSEKDALTGGENQQGFIKKVENLLQKREKTYAILCLDVKNFKAINGLFGIAEGNDLLRRLYQDLENSFLEPLITARVEADQYLCLFEWDKLDCEKLALWCEKEYIIKGRPFRVSKRCGIYRIQDAAADVRNMCDRARLAMSVAKRGRSPKPFVVFDDMMGKEYIDLFEMLAQFDNSLKSGEFCVYIQPVVNPVTGQISSAEALVRWNCMGKGIISPQRFIPLLEDSGDISQLDLYVVRKVEKFQREREEQGLPTVPISVNLSWIDFYDNALLEWLCSYVASRKDKKHTIRFEITETSYAAVAENRSLLFEQLRHHGVELLLDDFGSGYSSFSTLHNYDFDILKIDMGFVRRIEESDKTKSIIDSIVKMAHQMDVRTIAEGAETREQVEFLREKGCDYIQGYYFYKPMPMEDFASILDSCGV
ncbi:putative bifunctional diguanylate cyclase/phosphodiesterase [Frisingicoccus sp.]|uniref:putative bifunctional diguanylate cyclase/phosphodiesterase n=1 Tax=Frisingicoccus sp. TaxID=1918627 RepID=UPI003AB4FAC5